MLTGCMKFFLLLLVVMPFVSGLEISEIMYNPAGSDNMQEYVELYSEEEVNLSVYTFEDSASSDALTLVQQADSRYYLIVEDGFNATGINASVYSAGASLGNNLNNDGDVVMLRDNQGTVVEVISYTNSIGGNGNGMALCRNVTLIECLSTPGRENVFNATSSNSSQQNNTTNNSSPVDYGHVRLHEFLPNPQGLDTEQMPDGEWVELHNKGDGIDAGGLEICDKEWNCVLIDGNQTLSGTFVGTRGNLEEYMNGRTMLNNAGTEKVRLVHEGQILDETTYEGSKDGSSWSLLDEEWKLTKPTPGSENREPLPPEQEKFLNTSRVLIKKVSVGKDNLTRFGETIDVRVHVYKGNTQQERLKVYVENISSEVQFSVLEKYREYEMVLPVQLVENCGRKHPEGRYAVVVEGLGMRVQERMQVNHTLSCHQSQGFTPLSHQRATESIINESLGSSSQLTGRAVYRSKEERIREYGVYGFLLLIVLLLGYFLLQR